MPVPSDIDTPDDDAPDPAGLASAAEEAADAAIPRCYPNAAQWVAEWLVLHYGRDNPGFRWCRRWWDHPEAAARLEALWQAWETARADEDDPAAMSSWWLEHADPHMQLLGSEAGPFAQCDATSGAHHAPATLPVVSPPDGMYRGWDHPEENPEHEEAT